MKLLAFILSGQTLGVDIESWNVTQLSGNIPFTIINDNDSIPSGYTDISSIENWSKFSSGIIDNFYYMSTRNEIQKLLSPEVATGNTSGLTSSELAVVQEYNLDRYYILYDYFEKLPENVDVKEPPVDFNYDILGLHKKRIFNKGELYRVEYYADYDFTNERYDKLILHEDRVYHRINEMVYKRDMEIFWYLNNGLSGATKQTVKYYTQEESTVVGERRRRNIISSQKINIVGLIMQTSGVTLTEAQNLGFEFLSQYSSAIDVYIEGALQFLYDAILNDTNHLWLNNIIPNTGGMTIRNYIYSQVLLDYTINNTYI